MKTSIRFGVYVLFTACVSVLGACTDEYEYDAAAPVKDNSKATLSAIQQSFEIDASEATKTIEFTVKREKTDAAENIKLVSSSEKFSVPAEVSFAAGESEKTVTGTATVDNKGETLTAFVSISEDNANLYGDYKLEFSVFRDYTYTSLGKGVLNSKFFNKNNVPVEFEKADGGNWYKVIAPYADGYNLVFKVADDGKTVKVDKQPVYVDSEYGIMSVAGEGTLENGVISVSLTFTVSAEIFGVSKEVFTLPE